MSHLKSCLFAVSFSPIVLCAQNLVKNSDAEAELDNWNKSQVQVAAENPKSGKNCFKMLSKEVQSSEVIPIDVTKKYKISVWIKSADDKKTDFYIGLIPFDADKKRIQSPFVNTVLNSESELAEDCKPGDILIKVKDASKWAIKDKYNYIAFMTDNSGEYKDLPNSNLSSPVIKAEQKNDCWEIILEKPLCQSYGANTSVRLQRAGATYMYLASSGNFQSSEWKEFSGEIKGEAQFGVPWKQFWTKTKYVKIVICALNGGMLYFDDLNLEEDI